MNKLRLYLVLMAMLLPLAGWCAVGDEFQSDVSNVPVWFTVTGENTVKVGRLTGSWDNRAIDASSTGSIDLPETVVHDGKIYRITEIGPYAFYNCRGLTSVTMPNSVTSIGTYAFGSCKSLASMTIPDGVTSIGNYAFYECSGLTSLTISNSVTSIGSSAFSWCSSLTSLTIPNSVTSIGSDAFSYCSRLNSVTFHCPEIGSWFSNKTSIKEIVIGDEVTSIGSSAFSGCSGLTSVTIPNSVTSIGGGAFSQCRGLTSLTIPNSVTSIGASTFNGCSGLTSVTIPNSITSIGGSAFNGCSGLTSLTIPNSVTSIGWSAFSECSGLTSLTIPNSVTSIDRYAFSYCSGLTSLTIPNSATSIDSYAFYQCSGLTSVTFHCPEIGSWFNGYTSIKEIVIGDEVTSVGNYAFSGCSGLTSLTILNSVTSIGEGAFSRCSGLTSLTIPNSVTSIGSSAFSGCSGLTSLTIPNSVTSIGSSAFAGCSGLTSVTFHCLEIGSWFNGNTSIKEIIIGDEVTSIGGSAFSRFSGLTSLTIPNSVTSIGSSAFSDCSGLTSLTIPNSVTSIGSDAFSRCSGLTSLTIPNSVTSIGSSAFYDCSSLTTVTIPNSVTSIGSSAFSGCSGLTSLTIPNSVTSISDYAFSRCSGLTSLTIPNSVTSIGSYAFSNCTSFTSFDIPNSVTSIGASAFNGCSGLTSVTIPNSITSIGSDAFSYCSGLTSLTIPNSVTSIGEGAFWGCSGLTSLTIPNSVTSIGASAFRGCSGLTSVTIPNSVTSIGSYAFSNCTSFTSFDIPNSVTSIGNSAFYGCSGLTSVTIPNSVTSIGASAFWGCDDLKNVVSFISEPFAIGWYCFFNRRLQDFTDAVLSVPAGTLELYKKTDGWNKFGVIQEFSSSVTLQVKDDKENPLTEGYEVSWYGSDGNLITTGNVIGGIEHDSELYYSVELNETLGRIYRNVVKRKAGAKDETIVCQLQPIEELTLQGTIMANGVGLPRAEVCFRQWLNGKYEQTFTVKTDADGKFTVKGYNDRTEVIVRCDGYADCNLTFDELKNDGQLGTIELQQVSGKEISLLLTYQEAGKEGTEASVQNWFGDTHNIAYQVYNVTKGQEISDYALQQGGIVLPSGVDAGDCIRVTLQSLNGKFVEVSREGVISEEGTLTMEIPLVAYGGFEAIFSKDSDTELLTILFDESGKLVAQSAFTSSRQTFSGLKSGSYTLVTMGSNGLIGSVGELADFGLMGLSENTDYVKNMVSVRDGIIGQVAVTAVPEIDASKFEFTGESTSYLPNKGQMVVGNYVTLTARVDFKTQYAGQVKNVKLLVDIPEGCEFVSSSVVTGTKPLVHSVTDKRVSITLGEEDIDCRIRFCMIPKKQGTFSSVAYATFDYHGEKIVPIGSSVFEATEGTINVPSKSSYAVIPLNGIAPPRATLDIYDNGQLIGSAKALADGNWNAKCPLYKPYSLSTHEIYAKYQSDDGISGVTASKKCFYEKTSLEVKTVTMTFYHGSQKRNIDTTFDFQTGKTSSTNYSFYNDTDFTFVADLTDNGKNAAESVTFYVQTTSKRVRTLKGFYDNKRCRWVAVGKFSSNDLPTNLSVDVVPSSGSYVPSSGSYVPLADTQKTSDVLKEIDSFASAAIDGDEQLNTLDSQVAGALENDEYDYDEVLQLLNQYEGAEVKAIHDDEVMSMADDEFETYLASLSDELDALDDSDIYDECLAAIKSHQRYGSTIETMEDGTTIKKTVSTCEGMTKEGLLNDGFKEVPSTTGDILEKRTTAVYTYVDLGNNICITYEKSGVNASRRIDFNQNRALGSLGSDLLSFIDETLDNLLTDGDKLSALYAKLNTDRKMRLDKIVNLEKSYNKSLAKIDKQLETAFGLKEANLLYQRKQVLEKMNKLEKKKCKMMKLPRSVAVINSTLMQIPDVVELFRRIRDYYQRISNLSVPECTIQQNPAAAKLIQQKITQIENEFREYAYWRLSLFAVSKIGDLVLRKIPLLGISLNVLEDLAVSIRDEQFDRFTGNGINQAQQWITDAKRKCETDDDDNNDDSNEVKPLGTNNTGTIPTPPFRNVTPIIDPSGFVYEAVPTNRLSGVTATIYYDDNGPQLWDATEYSQVNPIVTDETGLYAWDVPMGQWQVRFEKSGYETTQTEWLPVPPPQLEINIPMSQAVAPCVEKAKGAESGITLTFSKYMKPETVTQSGRVSVTVNGSDVDGEVTLVDLEEDPYSHKSFVSKVKFVPETAFKTTDEVIVTVKKEVESYADKQMEADFVERVAIEPELEGIESEDLLAVDYEGKATLEFAVLPADAAKGKTVMVESTSPLIASLGVTTVTLDDEGKGRLEVSGELPGSASIHLSMPDAEIEKYVEVAVVMKESVVKAPKATKLSGSTFESDYLLTLTTATKGATIYYTLDGSCPCDEQKRVKYTAPFALPEGTVTLKAIAVRDGMEDSDVANFSYTVKSAVVMGDVNGDGNVDVADVVAIVNYILQKPTGNFIVAAAKVTGNDDIDVADVVGVVNIILGKNVAGARELYRLADKQTEHDMLALVRHEDNSLSLLLDNTADYIAAQFDVRLSEGQTLEQVTKGQRARGHQLATAKIADDTYRVLLYTIGDRTFSGQSGEVVSLGVAGEGDVSVENITFITAGESRKKFDDLSNQLTGIDAVLNNGGETTTDNSDGWYDLRGQRLDTKPTKAGVYIRDGRKVVEK